MGAKSVVMTDANKENRLNQLVGHKCMALSMAILIEEAQNRLPELVELARSLLVNAGDQPVADVGPLMISPQAKE